MKSLQQFIIESQQENPWKNADWGQLKRDIKRELGVDITIEYDEELNELGIKPNSVVKGGGDVFVEMIQRYTSTLKFEEQKGDWFYFVKK